MYKIFKCCFGCIVIIALFSLHAHTQEIDSITTLPSVTIKAFEQAASTSSHSAILNKNNSSNLLFNPASIVTGVNTISGVKMEERSPGSYRLNIRGSSLRAPFGVRNVKIYWNGLPLTDPSGNSYFNQLAVNNFTHLQIVKGPVSSMYGSGTGGLVLLEKGAYITPAFSTEYIIGSYGLRHLLMEGNIGKSNKNFQSISYNHSKSNGYRNQTNIRKDNLSWTGNFTLSNKHTIKPSILYTDLFYQTPGALTITEYKANRKSSRPATATLPSAESVNAAIDQKNFLAGLLHHFSINKEWEWKNMLYGSYSQIKNSAIRNYEKRYEPHFGGRSIFNYQKKIKNDSLTISFGGEFQQGNAKINVYANNLGNPDTVQTNDKIETITYSLFTQAVLYTKEWFFLAGLGYNKHELSFTRLNTFPVETISFNYKNELAPRFSINKKWGNNGSIQATIAKGFSPPTVSELLPSTTILNPNLHAERGWNHEINIQKKILQNKIQIELNSFYFRLKDALVQRRDDSGADYFINAGSTHQKGMELSSSFFHHFSDYSFLNSLVIKSAYTFLHSKYKNFINNSNNFSGNYLPGIPQHALTLTSQISFKQGFYFHLLFSYNDKEFLNDANSEIASNYSLVHLKLGWQKTNKKLSFYTGIDNLTNTKYSLGNDINAMGGRYYNAAPLRNFYISAALKL